MPVPVRSHGPSSRARGHGPGSMGSMDEVGFGPVEGITHVMMNWAAKHGGIAVVL
jgi:hypothetical protein